MRIRISNYLRGISALLSDIALFGLIVGLIPLLAGWELHIALMCWIVCVCLLFLADDLMVSFGVPVNAYLIANGLMIGGMTFLTFRASWWLPDSFDIQVLLGFGVVGTGIHGAIAAWRLPGSNGLVRYVDCIAGAAAFYLYAVYFTGRPCNPEFFFLALAAMALDLVTVNRLRTGDESERVIHGAGVGGKMVLALMLAGFLAVTAVVVGLASGQIHGAVDILLVILSWLWKIAEVVFGVIGKVLGGIILLLVMLLPGTPKAARETMMASVQESTEEIVDTAGIAVPDWVFYAVLGAGALALTCWIMYQLRHTRLKRRAFRPGRRRVVRRSYLFPALLELCRRLKDRIVFAWLYRRFRKTPQGLLVMAEQIGRQRKVGRRVNEGPGEYLRRLDRVLSAQPGQGERQTSGSLADLGEMLDKIYYAGQSCGLTPAEYKHYAELLQTLQ